MLLKKNRLDKKTLSKVFKEGRFVNSASLSLKYLKTNTIEENKISFVVPKAISKSAVKRNFLRRKGYNSLKKNINLIPFSMKGVFIINNKNIENIENEIKNIFKKISDKNN